MSDSPQGPGWWQASDGKWYPPEQAPGGSPAPAGGGASGTLDVGSALSYGWNKFVQYIGQVIVIVLIIIAVQVVFFFVRQIVAGSFDSFIVGWTVGMLLWAVGWFLYFLLTAGLVRAALAITRGESPEPSLLFSTENLGPFAIASIIVSALTFVGFFACCVGALVVWFFTYFYGFYVLDKQASPVDSIKASFELVKNNAGTVAILMLVVLVLNAVTCGLASGVTFIALAYAYKQLNGEPVAP